MMNMPRKSHETSKPSRRPERSVVKCNETSLPHSCYKGFSELCQRVKSLKSLGDWSLKIFDNRILLKKMLDQYVLPHLEIVIDESLGFTVKGFGSYPILSYPKIILCTCIIVEQFEKLLYLTYEGNWRGTSCVMESLQWNSMSNCIIM